MSSDALPGEIIRAYDVRGTTPDQINPGVAGRIGNGFARWLRAQGGDSLLIGHDQRATSTELYEAAIDGAMRAGIDVHAAGLAPTPVIGWMVDQLRLGGGLIVTASHNPPQFNGFKLLGSRSQPLLPEEIQQVARTRPRSGRLRGGCVEFDVIEPYLELLRRRFRCDTGLRVAIDAGNGTTGLTAPRALLALGVELHAIRTVPRPTDGRAADPQDPESMRSLARVTRAIGAELGLSWDGDGDRIGVLDEHGRRYEADWLTAVLARPLLERRSGAEILFDMKASTSAIEDVRLRGGEPVLARTGYSFFRRLMRERAISFGGETSGHIMFGPDYRDGEHAPWIDDGVFAACALVASLSANGRTLSEEMAEIEPRPISPELRLPCPDADKTQVADAIGDWFAMRHSEARVDRSDGARVSLEAGWIHARGSNTAPALSVRFEAGNEDTYRRLAEQLAEALARHPQVGGTAQLDDPPTIGPQLLT